MVEKHEHRIHPDSAGRILRRLAASAAVAIVMVALAGCYGPVTTQRWTSTVHCASRVTDWFGTPLGASDYDRDVWVDLDLPEWVEPGDAVPFARVDGDPGLAYTLSVHAEGLDEDLQWSTDSGTPSGLVVAPAGGEVVLTLGSFYRIQVISVAGAAVIDRTTCTTPAGGDGVIARIPVRAHETAPAG